eukprot:TRINITY_DN64695_c0_g1_i1.p1 TRINITY_DN64695_c0_g1~~TRINITY_DN64695_c0_g1_i1.p1  ORF type:complete len:100 (+),score=2.09 TRINITY_DN64695_c0_g1_i1:62-361(+)
MRGSSRPSCVANKHRQKTTASLQQQYLFLPDKKASDYCCGCRMESGLTKASLPLSFPPHGHIPLPLMCLSFGPGIGPGKNHDHTYSSSPPAFPTTLHRQ